MSGAGRYRADEHLYCRSAKRGAFRKLFVQANRAWYSTALGAPCVDRNHPEDNMSTVETERVLVVPASLLNDLGYFQGFHPDTENYLSELLKAEHASYRPRAEMEEDPSFKQLIPYVVFQHVDTSNEVRLFAYTRGSGQGEKRLRRKRSIGVGGHICVDDVVAGQSPYDEGMRRELAEEVNIGSTYSSKCVGLINDDETEVGRVHLGVVHVFDLQEPVVQSREEDLAESGFVSVDAILNEIDSFETWSQICLKALYG